MNPTDEAAIEGWPTEQDDADMREYEADERAAGRDSWDDEDPQPAPTAGSASTEPTSGDQDAYDLAIVLGTDAIEDADDLARPHSARDRAAHFAAVVVDALADRPDILGALLKRFNDRDYDQTVRDAWRSR